MYILFVHVFNTMSNVEEDLVNLGRWRCGSGGSDQTPNVRERGSVASWRGKYWTSEKFWDSDFIGTSDCKKHDLQKTVFRINFHPVRKTFVLKIEPREISVSSRGHVSCTRLYSIYKYNIYSIYRDVERSLTRAMSSSWFEGARFDSREQ